MTGKQGFANRSDRILLAVIASAAILIIALHVVGATVFKLSLWGLHLYAFFPPVLLVVASSVVLLIASLLLFRQERVTRGLSSLGGSPLSRSRFVLPALVLMGALAFWVGRSSHTYLGDGTVLIHSVPAGQTFHPREPLTMMLQQYIYQTAGRFFDSGTRPADRVAQDAIALGSVLAGLVLIVLSWVLARELVALRGDEKQTRASTRVTSLLISLLVLTQGYVQLFFGYVENYAFYTVAIALYLWLSLRFMRGVGPLLLPACAFLLGVALHIGFVIMLPSFGILAMWSLARRETRVGAVRDLLLTVAALVGLQQAFAGMDAGYSLLSTLLETTGLAVTRKAETVPMFSSAHVRDFLNEQFLIGPLGLLLFVAATATTLVIRTSMTIAHVFLFASGLSYLGASWLAGDSNLGYARDWDVWAAGGLVFTTAGVGVFLALGSRFRGASPRAGSNSTLLTALLVALLVSLYHTGPWILINASKERSLARLQTLPLGLGRTEVLVSQWYRREGNDSERVRWLERAIQVNPANNNAHHLLGVYYMEKGDMRSAADAFTRAVELRPDKLLFRHLLIDALTEIGEFEATLQHFEFSLEREPDSAKRWMLYGQALRQSGQREKANAVFAKALPLYAALVERQPDDYETNLGYGWLLYNLKQYEQSLLHFQAAHRASPTSASSLCWIGYALRSLQRDGEAVDYFKRCLALDPNRADRRDIETWMRRVVD